MPFHRSRKLVNYFTQNVFTGFFDTICEMHHILPCLNLYFKGGTKPPQNTSTVEILKCIRNCVNSAINPNFLLLVGIVENCPTEKG